MSNAVYEKYYPLPRGWCGLKGNIYQNCSSFSVFSLVFLMHCIKINKWHERERWWISLIVRLFNRLPGGLSHTMAVVQASPPGLRSPALFLAMKPFILSSASALQTSITFHNTQENVITASYPITSCTKGKQGTDKPGQDAVVMWVCGTRAAQPLLLGHATRWKPSLLLQSTSFLPAYKHICYVADKENLILGPFVGPADTTLLKSWDWTPDLVGLWFKVYCSVQYSFPIVLSTSKQRENADAICT